MVLKSFEIQILKNGDWIVDSIFDDRELAVFEARRADDSRRHTDVRVVEESFDESDGKTNTRVIFRGSRAARTVEAAPRAEQRGTSRQQRMQPGRVRTRAAGRSSKMSRDREIRREALLVSLVFAAVFVAMIILSKLS